MFALLGGAAIAQVAAGNPVPHDQAPDDHVTVSSSDSSRKLARHESGNPAAPNTIYYRITLCQGATAKENTFKPPKSDLKAAGLQGGPDQVGQGATSDNREKGGAAGLFNGTDGTLSITGSHDGVLTWKLKDGNGNTATFILRVHFVDCSEHHGAHSGSNNPKEKEIAMNVLEGQDTGDQQYATATGTYDSRSLDSSVFADVAYTGDVVPIAGDSSGNDGGQTWDPKRGWVYPGKAPPPRERWHPHGGMDDAVPKCTANTKPPTLTLDDPSDVQEVKGDLVPIAGDSSKSSSDDVVMNKGGNTPNASSEAIVDKATAELLRIAQERDNALKQYDALPSDAKKYMPIKQNLASLDKREADARATRSDAQTKLDQSSGKTTDSGTANKPVDATNKPTDANKPTETTTTPTAAPTDQTPTTTTAEQTPTTTDGGTPYISIGAKIIQTTIPGKLGDPEPGKLLSFDTMKYDTDFTKKPQDGYDKNRAICTTGNDGTCETKIDKDDAPHYGLKDYKPSYKFTFDDMLTRGGYHHVDPKEIVKTDYSFGDNFKTSSYALKIGDSWWVRDTYTTPYGTGDGYPKGGYAFYIVDGCLVIQPAPWGAAFDAPPAHSDLPMAAIKLGPSAGIVQ